MFTVRGLGVALAVAVAAIASHLPSLDPYNPLTIGDQATVAASMRASGYGSLASGRQFIGFDPFGDGRAIEVVGDLAAADRIVVLVPGSDTTLADFDRGWGGVSRRAPSVQARALHAAVLSEAPQAKVAVVAWLGYDPPEGVGVAAARQDRALAGARALTDFAGRLPPQTTVVVVGHSYGTVVAALAAGTLPVQVTDIVALASPGMGASSVADLRTRARVWTATATDDWIARVPHLRIGGLGHGGIPSDARRLPTDGVSGHDGYLIPGSSTLRALAQQVILDPAPREARA